jgi:hypothetical protein
MITLIQLLVARALASAYNHNWGRLTAKEVAELYHRASFNEELCQLITEAANEITSDGPIAVADSMAPAIESGHIVHTTGSGRLTWDVCNNGAVGFGIHRPGPNEDIQDLLVLDVLVNIKLDPDYPIEYPMRGWVKDAEAYAAYGPRHIYALKGALSAVGTYLSPAQERELWLNADFLEVAKEECQFQERVQ